MFGGLMKGMEKEGRMSTENAGLPLLAAFGNRITIGSNYSQRRPFTSNGSMMTAPC